VFAHVGGYQSGTAFSHGTNVAVFVGAGVVAVGAVAAALIRHRPALAPAVEMDLELEAA